MKTLWAAVSIGKRRILLLYPALALTAVASVWATLGAAFGPEPPSRDRGGLSEPSYGRQAGDLSIDGRLAFPRTADLKFDTRGTVGEILVENGRRVEQGQVLARMDSMTMARLENNAAGAIVNVRRAKGTLDTVNAATPVELAQAESMVAGAKVLVDNAQEALDNLVLPEDTAVASKEVAVARAKLALKSAEEKLDDLERDHAQRLSLSVRALAAASVALDQAWDAVADLDVHQEQRLGQALQGYAAAELALDQAQEMLDEFDLHHARSLAGAQQTTAGTGIALDVAEDSLADFLIDHSQRLAEAQAGKTAAELALDQARTALSDFDPQHAQRLAAALLTKSSAESALDRAEDNLANFDLDYAERLAAAQLSHTRAKLDLDAADDTVSRHIFTAGVSRAFDEDFIEELRALQAAAALALANFNTAKDRLAELETGPDPLVKQELESAVDLARTNLEVAEQALATLERGQELLLARQLSAAVSVAESNLRKITQVVARLEEGPDALEKQRLEATVALAKVALTDAQGELEESEEGPDTLLRAQLEADVTAARAALATAAQSLDKVQRDAEDLKIFAETGVLESVEGMLDAQSQESQGAGPRVLIAEAGAAQLILTEARNALAAGADPLEVALRVSQLDGALADLEQARDALVDLGLEADPRDRGLLESQVEAAGANLDQAIEDLEDLTINIDPLLVEAATRDLGVTEARLREAEIRLESLRGRLDLDRDHRQADLYLAEEAAKDAESDLARATITAPFDGVVYLVNADPDDEVDKDSLILRLVDPTLVYVAGFVNGSDVGRVRVGAGAEITLDSMPESPLTGNVTAVADSPRTDRGILTYEVSIRADAPQGIDVRLTGVSVTITADGSAQ